MATINTTSADDLRKLLNSSIALIAVTFIKLDGNERTVIGSTNPVYIPASDRPKSSPIVGDLAPAKSEAQQNTITMFEVFEGQWRSIKYDRITKVEVAEIQPEVSVDVEEGEFDFGTAIEFMKTGQCVARKGWNGKNMCIWLEYGNIAIDTIATDPTINGVSTSLFNLGDNGTITRMPHINMRAADGSTVVGWLASQTDMLAEDWTLLDE